MNKNILPAVGIIIVAIILSRPESVYRYDHHQRLGLAIYHSRYVFFRHGLNNLFRVEKLACVMATLTTENAEGDYKNANFMPPKVNMEKSK
jgi:hypothetical protein